MQGSLDPFSNQSMYELFTESCLNLAARFTLLLAMFLIFLLPGFEVRANNSTTPLRLVGPKSEGALNQKIIKLTDSSSHTRADLKLRDIGQFPMKQYDLSLLSDELSFANEIRQWIYIGELQQRAKSLRVPGQTSVRPLTEIESRLLVNSELEIDQDILTGLKLMLSILNQYGANAAGISQSEKQKMIWDLSHLADAVSNNYRYPVPHYTLADVVGDRRMGISPLRNPVATKADSLRMDRYSNLAMQDLTFGFGRNSPLFNGTEIFEYDRKKTGYGSHAGFRVKLGNRKFKIRLGSEVRTGPLNARIMDLLGYHVPEIHHVAQFKMKFDRRLFTEFNSRRELDLQLRFGQAPLFNLPIQSYIHPFKYIRSARLKNGQVITSAELEQKMIGQVMSQNQTSRLNNSSLTELMDQHGKEFEKEIAEIWFVPLSIEEKNGSSIEVGPWDFNTNGHEQKQEMRALAYVSAWLGMFDIRMENTRLSLVPTADGYLMKHVLSDIGSGWGVTDIPYHNDQIDLFPETFVVYEAWPRRILSNNVVPNEKNLAFQSMTIEDARFAARLIQGVSELHLRQALRASGFSGAEFEAALRKILSRKADALSILDPSY